MKTVFITIGILVAANAWLLIHLWKKTKEWEKWDKILEPFREKDDDFINFS